MRVKTLPGSLFTVCRNYKKSLIIELLFEIDHLGIFILRVDKWDFFVNIPSFYENQSRSDSFLQLGHNVISYNFLHPPTSTSFTKRCKKGSYVWNVRVKSCFYPRFRLLDKKKKQKKKRRRGSNRIAQKWLLPTLSRSTSVLLQKF